MYDTHIWRAFLFWCEFKLLVCKNIRQSDVRQTTAVLDNTKFYQSVHVVIWAAKSFWEVPADTHAQTRARSIWASSIIVGGDDADDDDNDKRYSKRGPPAIFIRNTTIYTI